MDTIHWFLDGKEDIRSSYYLAKDWNLPDMHFKNYGWDHERDHDWHEFASVEETNEPVTLKISIENIIDLIVKPNQCAFP